MTDIPGASKNLDGGNDGFTIVTRRKIDQGAKVKNEETNSPNTRNALQRRSEFLKIPTTSSNQGSPSTSTDMASPGPSHMFSSNTGSPAVSTVNAQSTEVRRKTKKKKESKEARLRRREEEKFKALYGSKDSRIQVMSTALFAKIQANQFGKSKTPESKPIEDSFPIWPTTDPELVMFPKPVWVKQGNFSSDIMKSEFPELGTASASNSKNNQSSQGKTGDSRLENKNVGPSSTFANHENETHLPEEPSSIDMTPQTSTEGATFRTALKKEKPAIPEIVSTPPPEPPKLNKKKPSKSPLIISINSLLSAKKNSASKQSTQAKLKASRKPTRTNEKIQPAGNVLDSSGIKVMHRGKMRETPKKKKPTKLKRAILLSRQLRKQLVISENENFRGLNEGDDEKLESLPTLTSNLSLIERNSISNMPVAERCLLQPKSEGKSQGGFEEEQEGQPEVKEEDDPEAFTEDFDSNFTPPQEVTLKPDYFRDLVENSLNPEAPIEAETTEADTSAPPLSPEIIETVKSQMHSRKFRKYCDMYTSKEMHGLVIGLLKQLHHFQDKLYKTDLLKYKLKKRYVHGIREISNFMSINKIQMIILAPDIESNKNVEGGLDDLLEGLLTTAKSKNVPVILSGNRYILGKPIYMKTPVSAIGILDHQGAEDLYRKMLEEATQLRLKYQEEFNTRVQAIQSQSPVIVQKT